MAVDMTILNSASDAAQQMGAGGAHDLSVERMDVITPDAVSLDKNCIVGFSRNDVRARPFALLRTQVAKRIEANNLKLIGITSATPEAGKSFVALNLAASLARVSENGVFLADFDLRRGSVARGLGIEVEQGVSDFLAGTVPSLDLIAQHIEGTHLNVLMTKAVDSKSAELVSGPRFEGLISDLRTRTGSAVVICDLPPAFANDEAMMMMQHLDAYVFIVDSGRNNRKQVRNALSMFRPTPCIGTVLNRYRGGLIDDSGYGYGYGYGKSAYDSYY